MIYLLADIGGTHARCALFDGNEISKIEVISANDFSNGQDLFLSYISRHVQPNTSLCCAIAAAGRLDDDGIWRVGNNKDWEISPRALKEAGYEVKHLIGDFVATSAGVVGLERDDCVELFKGSGAEGDTLAVCGPGTGLGLSYIINSAGNKHIHRTHGGHMGVVSSTQQQQAIVRYMQKRLDTEFVTYEDVCSGRSLVNLYRATCESKAIHRNPNIQSPEDILTYAKEEGVQETLKVFHEFLGLFLQTIMVSAHAVGGVYLDGGVIQKLHKHNLLDVSSLLKFAQGCSNARVTQSLKSASIYLIDTPYVALTGLAKIIKGEIRA